MNAEAIAISAFGSPRRDHLGSGYFLAFAVHADGLAWPVVVDERVRATTRIKCRPEHWRGTIHDDSERFEPRCGQRCADGHMCRSVVARVGDACRWHQSRASGDGE